MDQNCKEWAFQSKIKKIMATKNIFYWDTLDFKKNNYYFSAFKYLDIANRQYPVSINSLNKKPHKVDFSNLNIYNAACYSAKKKKPKFNLSSLFKNIFPSFKNRFSLYPMLIA